MWYRMAPWSWQHLLTKMMLHSLLQMILLLQLLLESTTALRQNLLATARGTGPLKPQMILIRQPVSEYGMATTRMQLHQQLLSHPKLHWQLLQKLPPTSLRLLLGPLLLMMCHLHQHLIERPIGQLLLYQLRPQPCLSEQATKHPEQATQHPDQSIWHPDHLLAKLQQQMHLLHQPLPSRAIASALTAPLLAGRQQQGFRPTSCVRQELPWGCGNSCMRLHPHLLLFWPLSTGMPWQPGQSASGQTTLLLKGAFLGPGK